MLSLILVILPLVAGLIVLGLKHETLVKRASLVFSFLSLGLTIFAYSIVGSVNASWLQFSVPWLADAGSNFSLQPSGIGMVFLLLTNFLVPLIFVASWKSSFEKPSVFYALVLFTQFALCGVFLVSDVLMFYLFWEMALIPVYFLVAGWGSSKQVLITSKFFIYTLFGSLLLLFALLFVYFKTPGEHSFSFSAFYQAELTAKQQGILFWLAFVGFAVKMPIFPFHTWQPDTYTEAPTPVTMLLSGLLMKMGVYGLIVLFVPLFPLALGQWGYIALGLAIAGILYASIIAIRQDDLKRLAAYSSMAHGGLIAAGVLAANVYSMQGAVVQSFAHGVNVVALFFIVDFIEKNSGTRSIEKLGGIATHTYVFPVFFMIVLLASVGLPLTNSFIGEFLMITGIAKWGLVAAIIGGTSIIFGAVYMLWAYQRVMFGARKIDGNSFNQLHVSHWIFMISVVIIIFLMGLFPDLIVKMAAPAVDQVVKLAQALV